MKKFVISLVAAVVALTSSIALAGVVITETDNVTGPTTHSGEETLMIQGHKQKVVTENRVIITDLDKGSIYLVDPAQKKYLEMPFPPTGVMAQMVGGPAAHAKFSKTGKTETIAGYKCERYTGTGQFKMGNYTIDTCVTTKAPGAFEYSEFEKTMISKLQNTAMAMPANMPDGMPLAQETTTKITNVNMPNLTPQAAARLQQQFANRPPLVRRTAVTKIEVKQLAANTFQIPAGYTEREPMHGIPMGRPAGANPPAKGSAPSAGAGNSSH